MQRRKFIKDSTLFAMSVYAFGNIRWTKGQYKATDPTTTDILGPFYRPNAPIRTNIVPTGTSGELMHLSGTIFKDDGATPYNDCLVEIWQCSPAGIYDNTSDEYHFRGAQKTGNNGKYHFTTTIPVPYPIDDDKKIYRPAHVHMRISGNQGQDLVTQIYFRGDPYVEKDMYSKSPQAKNRILTVKQNANKENSVQFDIVMSKEFPLDDAAFEKITGIYNMDDRTLVEFYKNNNVLFAKINGQIKEALYYKGSGVFRSALDLTKVQFEVKEKGEVKVIINYRNELRNTTKRAEGTKTFKYKS